MAQRGCKHILACEVVADATEEGYQFRVVLIAAHTYLSLFLGILSRTKIVRTKSVIWEILVIGIETGVTRILVGITCHGFNVMLTETATVVGEPLNNLLAILAVRTACLALATIVYGNGAGGWTKPGVVVAVLVVGKHQLGGKAMIALSFLGKQRQEVELDGSVPIKKFSVALTLLELLTLYRVGAHHLSHEVIITCGILRVHHRCSRISLNGILKHSPVGIVTIYDSRSHIGGEGEQTTLARVHHRCTRSIFLALRTQVDTFCITIVGTDAVVVLVVAATHGEGVLHGNSCAAHRVKPIDIAAKVNTSVAPSETNVTIVLRAHHVEFFLDNIKRHHT